MPGATPQIPIGPTIPKPSPYPLFYDAPQLKSIELENVQVEQAGRGRSEKLSRASVARIRTAERSN
jgi:hypothetical protein